MQIIRWAGAAVVGAALALAAAAPAVAQETETLTEPGPVDLSGSDHATGNAGEHVQVGTLEVGDGEWTITASVRLFVPDPEPEANDGRGQWKNSQGCGLHVAGEQVGGAGGSSSLWTATGDGKEVVLELRPTDPDASAIVLEGPATVELVCFVDQSHSGAALEEREGMAATDIAITAVRTPDASPTPTPTIAPTEPPAGGGGDSDDQPALPLTGVSVTLLLGIGGGGVVAGGLALWAVRRRRVSFTA